MTDPQPPYTAVLPERYQNTPYADLPPGLRQRVDATATEAPAGEPSS